jgi:hypothetical protein
MVQAVRDVTINGERVRAERDGKVTWFSVDHELVVARPEVFRVVNARDVETRSRLRRLLVNAERSVTAELERRGGSTEARPPWRLGPVSTRRRPTGGTLRRPTRTGRKPWAL